MKIAATFEVYRGKSHKLQDNLFDFGAKEDYLVCKKRDNKNLLAIDISNNQFYINKNECLACQVCRLKYANSKDGVDLKGIPTEDDIAYSYESLEELLFRGEYTTFPSRNTSARPILQRFNHYTGGLDERNFTNPMAASLLLGISGGESYVSCSPSHELSLDVSILKGQREGHLDITLRSLHANAKYLLVGEGKRNVKTFLNDSPKEQHKKYENSIKNIADNFGYTPYFLYIIGGSEEGMYPPDTPSSPAANYRNQFFEDIKKNQKHFISIHALRGLGVIYIASGGKFSLKEILFPLLEDESFYGLVLGGVIIYEDGKFKLKSIE